MANYVWPTCAAVVAFEGGRVRLNPTVAWEDTHPFVKARKDLFTDVSPDVIHDPEPPVERGTRAPGEKRTYTRKTTK